MKKSQQVAVAIFALLLLAFGWYGIQARHAWDLAYGNIRTNAEWQPLVQRIGEARMVLVPAGCFEMGSTPAQVAEAQAACDQFYTGACIEDLSLELPAHQVCFEQPFLLDQYEVTNAAYGDSSSSNMITMYRGPSWPRETVTWQQAADFCEQRGARLPSEAEWEYAARGPDGLIYPWGNAFDIDRINRALGNPQDVGSMAEGPSWVGAYDMGGGVREWVQGLYATYDGDASGRLEGLHIVRGGSWFSFADFMYRTAGRGLLQGDYATSIVGFRCAKDT
jgi:formylglycine-generating enzyme required for sulfatase activity